MKRSLATLLLLGLALTACGPKAKPLNNSNALESAIDGGMGGNAIEKAELESSHTEGNRDLRIEFGSRLLDQELELVIETNLPAKNAKDESCSQMAIVMRECVDRFRTQQVIGVSFAALDGQQNVEGGFTRWRDGGHGAQLKRASAGSGFPRRNSSVVMRFLPSS